MKEPKVLENNSKLDGNKVIVTKKIEEQLTREDILQRKQNLYYQMQGLTQQLEQINYQVDRVRAQDEELDGYLAQLPAE